MTTPSVDVSILSPAAGSQVTRTLTVTGTAVVLDNGNRTVTSTTMSFVSIGLGPTGGGLADLNHQTGIWTFTGTIPGDVADGAAMVISVNGTGFYTTDPEAAEPLPADEGNAQITVQVEARPPDLTITPDYPTSVVPTSLPYQLTIHGTTNGSFAGINAVSYAVDAGPHGSAVNDSGDWSRWHAQITLPEARNYSFTVTASDTRNRSISRPGAIQVHQGFESTDPDVVFGQPIYVRELSDFAAQYVAVTGLSGGPNRAALTARFRQPFDRVSDAAVHAVVTAPVDQRRIAVEVLRAYLTTPAPADLDQGLRRLAYESLLRELGTSSVELRQARVAGSAQRAALAARLGLELGSARPDQLDDLTISPDEITDAQLESLFGFRSMSRTDPFQASTVPPVIATQQQAALRSLWRAEDSADRDRPGAELPLIDPDHVLAANLVSQQAGDPAHDLWAVRQQLIARLVAQIDQTIAQGNSSLATFDQLIRTQVGGLDLVALLARDRAGENLTDDLGPLRLSLPAFRYLAGARALLAGDGLLSSEWTDVRDVLVQVHKLGLFADWRREERENAIVLQPAQFLVDSSVDATAGSSVWRIDWEVHLDWERTLAVRTAQLERMRRDQQALLQAAEAAVLPVARDRLVVLIGTRHSPTEAAAVTAERLTRELCIDLLAASPVLTTRADQAMQTLLEAMLALRSGRFPVSTDGRAWSIIDGKETLFDSEWVWMGSYSTWFAAITAFAYPDNQLFPGLYLPDNLSLTPSASYLTFLNDLRAQRITRQRARDLAQQNWDRSLPALSATTQTRLRQLMPVTATGRLTEEHTNSQLAALRTGLDPLYTPDQQQGLRELFWLVPVALGLTLTDAGEFTAALDWYQYAYAYQLPAGQQRIFPGLARERDVKSVFARPSTWPADGTNPHEVALDRANVYTRFTIMSIVRCLLAYADNEFVRNTAASNATARALYEAALDLITSSDAAPEVGAAVPFPKNPTQTSLESSARSSLDKIHRGLNIASALPDGTTGDSVLPSQYRYSVLADRAKNLVATAAQLESAFLSAAELADAGAYTRIQATHDLEVAQAMISENDLKVSAAAVGVSQAGAQWERASVQAQHYSKLIAAGPNQHERDQLFDLGAARDLAALGGALSGIGSFVSSPTNIAGGLGAIASGLSQAASLDAQIEGVKASLERRQQEWQLQQSVALKDVEIGRDQITLAQTQQQIAQQERVIAGLQLSFASATADFLATKFTSAELFDWMSGVLNQVYAYFLRQATALARLAQAQLAFERQEPNRGLVQDDYWQGPPDAASGQADPTDRRGLTGSARLLEDLTRLDEYAFETDRRKLHLTQTISLAQVAAAELQQFRQSGILSFSTPEELFDRRFPGHYLRLIKRVRTSVIALVPPVTGLSATLSTSGVSRTVVSRETFETVTLRRDPESVAFTSPNNATGLFDLEADTGLLLPFEGMGVDSAWRLELPKAANSFDFRTIADVLLTFEYTALESRDHRHAVIRGLDRQYSVDRSFSLRTDFPDVWYDLSNPDTIDDPSQRMTALLSLSAADFPPHIPDLSVAQLTLFVVRKDTLTEETVDIVLRRSGVGSPFFEADPVSTVGGIVGTRRLGGAAWLGVLGTRPDADWQLQFPDTDQIRSWFADELIQDVVLVMTLNGTTPAWP